MSGVVRCGCIIYEVGDPYICPIHYHADSRVPGAGGEEGE